MKTCIVSDSHDRADALTQAVREAKTLGAEAVIHCGDLLLACTGDWALVCCGHSHRAAARKIASVKGAQTWLVNPGTVAGLAAPATWALGDLAAMQFEVRALGREGAFKASISA